MIGRRPLLATYAAFLLISSPASVQGQPPATATGALHVTVEPSARIYVDGDFVGTGTELRRNLVPGPHRLRVLSSDYEDLRRVVTIEANRTLVVSLKLSEKGIPKQRTTPQAGRGVSPPRGAAPESGDPNVAQGVAWFKEGDFAPAVDTLFAAGRNLEGVPRALPQRARAYLYLGASLVELDNLDDAKLAFAIAQRLERTLNPSPAEFSAEVRRLWADARSIVAVQDLELRPTNTPGQSQPVAPRPAASAAPTALTTTPASATTSTLESATPERGPSAVGSAAESAPTSTLRPPQPADTPAVDLRPGTPALSAEEFISDSPTKVNFRLLLVTDTTPCPGALSLDREQSELSWVADAPSCSTPLTVPFAEVRSPAAAPHGGLLLQFRSDRPSMTLVPAPDADLLATDVTPMGLSELPPEARVNLRRAHRRMMEALGRPYSDSLFGLLVDVPLAELLDNPSDYEGGSVRTRGTLSFTSNRGPYLLSDESTTVQLATGGASQALLRNKAAEWKGNELIVSGIFSRPVATDGGRRRAEPTQPAQFIVNVSSIEPADSIKFTGNARPSTLEDIVKDPPRPNDLVRVVGRFRGKNFFGDLPPLGRDIDTAADPWWTIKDGVFAIWVTGRPPNGDGFALDGLSPVDRQNWVAVVGRVAERKGVLYMRADRVELSAPPSDSSQVTTAQGRSGAALIRPDVSFTAPIEGSEEASRDQQFLIQFTKPMNEASFKDQVQLRYADSPSEVFPHVAVTYYPDRRFSIMVEPGAALQPGRTLECVLLPGIRDIDNQPLIAPGASPRVLRWKVRAR